jgi:hypothetical protein
MSIKNITNIPLEKIATSMIGEIEPTNTTEINEVECLTNGKNTILQTDTVEQAMKLLGNDAEALKRWIPDNIILKKWFKEYPFLVFLQQKLNMPFPDMWYYGEGKSLVIEYPDKCYIIAPVKF